MVRIRQYYTFFDFLCQYVDKEEFTTEFHGGKRSFTELLFVISLFFL